MIIAIAVFVVVFVIFVFVFVAVVNFVVIGPVAAAISGNSDTVLGGITIHWLQDFSSD
jgi:hypothetical protein